MFTNFRTTTVLLALTTLTTLHTTTMAAPLPTGAWPTSKGLVQKNAPITVKTGEVFDGKMQTYERSDITCTGQNEGGWRSAIFLVEPGATLKNVIIGKNQAEGVHCENSDCRIENVWWDDVCEDALSIKGGSASSVTTVIGGGARNADDKVIQHNGKGSVIIDGFYANTFGKLFRSCGQCGNVPRKVTISNVLAVNPKVGIATVNQNWNDQATLTNIHIRTNKAKVEVCGWSLGKTDGSEPGHLGDGPKPPLCNYSPSTIFITKL
jgi:hypothetical protein